MNPLCDECCANAPEAPDDLSAGSFDAHLAGNAMFSQDCQNEAALAWLRHNQPRSLQRGPVTYFYSDGSFQVTENDLFDGEITWTLQEGWHCNNTLAPHALSLLGSSPQGFDAVLAEFRKHLVPEKGSAYQDTALVNGELQLSFSVMPRRRLYFVK
jgi:hypothetical protein